MPYRAADEEVPESQGTTGFEKFDPARVVKT